MTCFAGIEVCYVDFLILFGFLEVGGFGGYLGLFLYYGALSVYLLEYFACGFCWVLFVAGMIWYDYLLTTWVLGGVVL